MTVLTPLEETTRNQRRASEPARSAFVMANAGSGKTRVLTNRVARLLLTDVKPEKILCITFTKAAAAEMAERLFNVLGEWALLDNESLQKALAELEGPEAQLRNENELAQVRRLFARALETPGGLKIQTIHSFCESVLRRFPIEAGTPPGFAILEDADAQRLIDDALNALARRSFKDAALNADLQRLGLTRNEQQMRELLARGAAARLDFETMLKRHDGLDSAISALGYTLNINPTLTEDELRQTFLETLSKSNMERAYDALMQSGGNPAKLGAHAKSYLDANIAQDQWSALEALFLTTTGGLRKQLATKATDNADPWARDYLTATQSAFGEAVDQNRALNIFHDSAAYYRLTADLIDSYAAAKATRAALDFDDLIARTLALFQNTDNTWVMYKLDAGVDHILIDEAQDTSPAQWAVIEALFSDYLSGAGARETPRSFFAVGDMKQSIYSFQGADVTLFKTKEIDLGENLAAVADYENVPLTLSFRTTAPVLRFVDEAFNDRSAAEGLGDYPIPRHGVKRDGEAGLVELWPLTPRPEMEKANPWDAPVDMPAEDHPVKTLSARISATINDWIKTGALLESQGRPIAPGDIMILVQSRGALFSEIIRRLAQAGVPVAGADRLRLLEDPAIEDLLSYAKFALYENDDLSLAEVLKSPLFGFDDDSDLFPLAHYRAQGQSLWSALKARSAENSKWAKVAQEIGAARTVGAYEGPYAFLSHVLEADAKRSGRRRFHERLSEAARDGVDELLRQALHYENMRPRSLRGFVDWFENSAGDIKREMENAGDAVRVMTVHGAKGLEANIVFLIDAHRTPRANSDHLLRLTDGADLNVLASAAANDIEHTAEARAEKKRRDYEEYRRLFYVAATRARDRLYICGVEDGRKTAKQDKDASVKSWHALSQDAFDRLAAETENEAAPFWEDGETCAIRLTSRQQAAVEEKAEADAKLAPSMPKWVFDNAAPEKGAARLAPSRLIGESDTGSNSGDVYSPTLGRDKYFRGRTLHRLLELLPDVGPDKRAAAADRLLSKLAGDVPAAERHEWREEVLAVIEDPQFSAVFGPGSRAEIAVAGCPKGAPATLQISGQIDRLTVTEQEVFIVDYKPTGRRP